MKLLISSDPQNKVSTLVSKDTVSGRVAGLDVVLHVLEQLPADRGERASNCDVLIAGTVREVVGRVLGTAQHQRYFVLGLRKHLKFTKRNFSCSQSLVTWVR